MKDYTYQIVIIKEPEDPGYYAVVPALPGCFSDGDTIEETITNVHEAILGYLEARQLVGDPVPEEQIAPVMTTVTVSLAA